MSQPSGDKRGTYPAPVMHRVGHEVAEQVSRGPKGTAIWLLLLLLGCPLRQLLPTLEVSTEMQTCSLGQKGPHRTNPSRGRAPVSEMAYLKALTSLNSSDPYESPEN